MCFLFVAIQCKYRLTEVALDTEGSISLYFRRLCSPDESNLFLILVGLCLETFDKLIYEHSELTKSASAYLKLVPNSALSQVLKTIGDGK